MFKKHLQNKVKIGNSPSATSFLLQKADQYLQVLTQDLDDQLDKRLVRTFYDLFMAILTFRNRAFGLLLTELGGYITGVQHAPAGTKRVSNLLRSKKWTHRQVEDFILERAADRSREMAQRGQEPLFLWDDSVIEKSESWCTEGLCAVNSSKGKRLTRIKRGFYRPPASRICVPGYQWSAVLLSAWRGVPSLCLMRWWTSRGKYQDSADNVFYCMLRCVKERMGKLGVHVLDRGYASLKTLERFAKFQLQVLVRWKGNINLCSLQGEVKKTHLIARSAKPMQSRSVWDKERKQIRRISLAYLPVRHAELPDVALTLIVIRDKQHARSPMYLLTSRQVDSLGVAWQTFFYYMHRWNIEQAFRFGKSELAMESPRLWFFQNTLKLLNIVSLVYDFLLRCLRNWRSWAYALLDTWCPRTGERYRKASIPLYRLRSAIAACFSLLIAQNSG